MNLLRTGILFAALTALVACEIHYAANGRCGKQADGAFCNQALGAGVCCSISGYCGNTTTYCEGGCQLNCTDDGAYTPSATTATATTTATASSTPAAAAGGLTTKEKVIIGCVVGPICLFILIALLLYWKRHRDRHQRHMQVQRAEENAGRLQLTITGPPSTIQAITAAVTRTGLANQGNHYANRGAVAYEVSEAGELHGR